VKSGEFRKRGKTKKDKSVIGGRGRVLQSSCFVILNELLGEEESLRRNRVYLWYTR